MIHMYGGILFTLILGVLLHYTYNWSGRNYLVAFVAPTNESSFEHLKLLATPFLLWALLEYFCYGQNMHGFVPSKVIGLYVAMILMVVLGKLSHFLFGHDHSLKVHIAVFILSVITAFVLSEFLMTLTFMDQLGLEVLFDGILMVTIMLFAVFTVYAPKCWLFQAPK